MNAHKLNNNILLLYDCQLSVNSLTPTMAAPTVNTLVESFENPHIHMIDGELTYATLHGMHELLNSKSASVATNLG